jgi:RNA polymerase sigma-70 factor (ECF subfamily)
VALPENAGELFRGLAPQPLEALADRDALQTALQSLSPVIRETFLMVFMQGETCREAAQALKVPLGTVLSRLDQARRALRVKLVDGTEGHGRNGEMAKVARTSAAATGGES